MLNKKQKKMAAYTVLSLVGVVGGAYALQQFKPAWAEKIGASWLLEKLKLIPPKEVIKLDTAAVETGGAEVSEPQQGKRTVAGRQYGAENGAGSGVKQSGGAGAISTMTLDTPRFIRPKLEYAI